MATDEKRTYPEGEWLAAEVRDLAIDARRILAAGQCGPREIAIVSRRVARLLAWMDGDPPSPTCRWLENLQRQVRGLGQSLGPWKSKGAIAPLPGIMRLFWGISSRNPPEFASREASSIASTIDALPTTPRSNG